MNSRERAIKCLSTLPNMTLGDGDCTTTILELLDLLDNRARVIERDKISQLPSGHVILETNRMSIYDDPWLYDALLFCRHTNYSVTFITLEGPLRMHLEDYGKTWRLWSAAPTYDQRREVKWNAAD